MCSADGAARLETILGKVGENLTLTDAQKELLSTLKTTALTAQTTYADNCVQPGAAKDSDMIDRLKARQTNMAAQVTAMDEVIPTLEAFYTSLSDEQKAELRPNRRDHTGERGERSGGKHQDHDRKHRG